MLFVNYSVFIAQGGVVMKSIMFILTACCLSLLAPALSYADDVRSCEPKQCGPCVCYCPMVKYVPKYHCEQKCYTEPYQVAKKCCRYVPQYYTKTYCKQVPEYYYTYETKYCKKYYTEKKCTYVAQKYIEKKCIDCPAVASPCADKGCNVRDSQDYSSRYSRGSSSCSGGSCRVN